MTAPNLDTLSPLARKLLRLENPDTYRELIPTARTHDPAIDILRDLTPRDLLSGNIVDENAAAAVLAGLWLRHDRLDEAHTICQALDTAEGSFWHAIVHRREGDFSNSKYWYARVGESPLYLTLAARAAETINPYPADKSVYRLIATGWNSAAFVDLVAAVHDQPNDPRRRLCVAIQEVEWQTLFEHCRRLATNG